MTFHDRTVQQYPGIRLVIVLILVAGMISQPLMASGGLYEPKQASATTWELLESDYPDSIFSDVSFINVTHGWIVGQKDSTPFSDVIILYTNDSGESWQLRHSGGSKWVTTIDILDDQTVWINGDDSLFYTLDGGKTWNQSVVSGTIGGLSTVKFINKTHGWTGNNEVLYRTIDSGQSWESVPGWNFSDHPRMMEILSPSFWDGLCEVLREVQDQVWFMDGVLL